MMEKRAYRSAAIECPICSSPRNKRIRRRCGDIRYLSCPVCSFQFIDPFVGDAQVFNDYIWTREYSNNYERYVGLIIESLRKKLEDVDILIGHKPASFLDVGCGNGIYLNAANILGLRNLGTDIDKVNIDFARAKNLDAITGALEDLEIRERYDFVHLKAVLHLVPNPGQMLARAASLLTPGGVIYIDVPNQGSLFSKVRMVRDRNSYGQLQLPHRRGAYNYRSLNFLCQKAGLRIAKRIYAYPGDRTYYPILGMKRTYLNLFKIFAKIHVSSMLGVYAVKKESPFSDV